VKSWRIISATRSPTLLREGRRPISVPVDVQRAEIDAVWQPVPDALCAAHVIDEQALASAVDLLSAE
jgi:hypothetical protein